MTEPVLIAANNYRPATTCDETKTENIAVARRSTSDEVDVPFTDNPIEAVLLTDITTTTSQNPPTHKESTKGYSCNNANVKFGTVHVHVHPMTLGANPEVGYGIPIELAWTKQDSVIYESIDEFEEAKKVSIANNQIENDPQLVDEANDPTISSYLPRKESRTVRRIPASEREAIATMNHSEDSIRRVTQEILSIQESRNDSRNDKLAQNVIIQLHRKPHEAVTSSTTTLDDVITAHLERASKQMKAKHKDELNNDNKKKKKRRWWSFCEL